MAHFTFAQQFDRFWLRTNFGQKSWRTTDKKDKIKHVIFPISNDDITGQ